MPDLGCRSHPTVRWGSQRFTIPSLRARRCGSASIFAFHRTDPSAASRESALATVLRARGLAVVHVAVRRKLARHLQQITAPSASIVAPIRMRVPVGLGGRLPLDAFAFGRHDTHRIEHVVRRRIDEVAHRSFTDTTGFISPQSCAASAVPDAGAGDTCDCGVEEEHESANVVATVTSRTAPTKRRGAETGHSGWKSSAAPARCCREAQGGQ